jgi:hypothetical protein
VADVTCLRDSGAGFPRPGAPSDILPAAPPGVLGREEIFESLVSPASEEWQHANDRKHHVRFVATPGWVFKANVWNRSPELPVIEDSIRTWQRRAGRLGIWHPDKQWFIVRADDHYWACNATPRLTTLPDLEAFPPHETAVHRWLMSARCWRMRSRTFCRHGFLLDGKPENFAVGGDTRKPFYIDDELYRFDNWRTLRLEHRLVR